jgi:hypothetical protein
MFASRPHTEDGGSTDRAIVKRTYYRIVHSADLSEDDFKSAKELGKPLLDPALER